MPKDGQGSALFYSHVCHMIHVHIHIPVCCSPGIFFFLEMTFCLNYIFVFW